MVYNEGYFWWEGRQKTVKPDSQAISTSLSGTWTMEDSINKMAGSLSLTQTGSNVKGVASLNRGTVRVEGEIAGNEVQLIFIHDNVSGLTNFTQEEVARQIVGITSKATMRLGGDVNKIEGTFYGWQVINDNSLLVTNRYEGGSSEAMRINPPRTFRLVRKGEGTSITLRPGEVWTGSIPAARTLELQARISYPMVAGGAFALEVQVNGQTISTPLLNKERQFRFADGRTFSYYDQGKQSWLIFYSPDFTTNDTGKAGGYQVLTDPGQAYRYVWDISSLMGNAAEFNLKIRHSLTGINNPIEVRINWK